MTDEVVARKIAAYLLDRADQYETESPCWVALSDAAYNIMAGDATESWNHGELNDPDLLKRVDGFAKLEKSIRPVVPTLGVEKDED